MAAISTSKLTFSGGTVRPIAGLSAPSSFSAPFGETSTVELVVWLEVDPAPAATHERRGGLTEA